LSGIAGQVDGQGFVLHGARVQLTPAGRTPGVSTGEEVSVRGQWDGQVLHAQQVSNDPGQRDLGHIKRVAYEGYLHAVSAHQVNVGGKQLTLSPEVKIGTAPGGKVAINQRVQVSGRVDANQRVTIDRMMVRSGPSDLGRTRVARSSDDRSSETASDDQKSDDVSKYSKSDSDSDDSDKSTSSSSSTTSNISGTSDNSGKGSSGSSSGSGSSGSSGSSGTSGSSGSSGKGSSGSGSSGGGKSGSGKK